MRLLLRFIVCHIMIIYLSPSGVYVTINACLKGPSVPQSELRYRLNYQHPLTSYAEVQGKNKLQLRNTCALVESIFVAFSNKLAFPTNGPLSLQSMCSSNNIGCADQVLGYIHLLNKTMELDVGQSFRKVISNHLFRWDVG